MLYIAKSLGKIEGKKKAYKLFYFLDFDFYEAYERPFTGDVYKSLKMGPVPVYFDAIAYELINEGKLKIESELMSPRHENETTIFTALSEATYQFTVEEKKMLDRVIRIYGPQTGKNLEVLSHAEAPYNAVSLFQMIPYEYSFYRDTPDLTL